MHGFTGSRVVRDYMPQQHRDFFSNQPLLYFAAQDPATGTVWASVLAGPRGFISSPTSQILSIAGPAHLAGGKPPALMATTLTAVLMITSALAVDTIFCHGNNVHYSLRNPLNSSRILAHHHLQFVRHNWFLQSFRQDQLITVFDGLSCGRCPARPCSRVSSGWQQDRDAGPGAHFPAPQSLEWHTDGTAG